MCEWLLDDLSLMRQIVCNNVPALRKKPKSNSMGLGPQHKTVCLPLELMHSNTPLTLEIHDHGRVVQHHYRIVASEKIQELGQA